MPPRPQPAQTLDQRAAIERGLERDRAALDARAAALPATVGAAAAPVEPPAAVAAKAGPPARSRAAAMPADDDEVAVAYVKEGMARAQDDGKLKDFLRQMERPVPGAVVPGSAQQALGLGVEAPVAADPAARGTFVGRMTFAPRSVRLAATDEALATAVPGTRAPGSLRVIVGGRDVAEREARATVIARTLVRLGAAPAAVLTLQGGDGDEAQVYRIGPAAAGAPAG